MQVNWNNKFWCIGAFERAAANEIAMVELWGNKNVFFFFLWKLELIKTIGKVIGNNKKCNGIAASISLRDEPI